eukprot:m.147356 g.147356  ORF g.147356 m.147356 type:complete len:278 (-) comp14985_c0_seq3:87-920(-)
MEVLISVVTIVEGLLLVVEEVKDNRDQRNIIARRCKNFSDFLRKLPKATKERLHEQNIINEFKTVVEDARERCEKFSGKHWFKKIFKRSKYAAAFDEVEKRLDQVVADANLCCTILALEALETEKQVNNEGIQIKNVIIKNPVWSRPREKKLKISTPKVKKQPNMKKRTPQKSTITSTSPAQTQLITDSDADMCDYRNPSPRMNLVEKNRSKHTRKKTYRKLRYDTRSYHKLTTPLPATATTTMDISATFSSDCETDIDLQLENLTQEFSKLHIGYK